MTAEGFKKDSSGEPLTKDTLEGDKGCVNIEFEYKNKLSSDSKPPEIADAFISSKHGKKNADNLFSFA